MTSSRTDGHSATVGSSTPSPTDVFVPSIVASDVDGTLLDSQHQLSPRTYRVIQEMDRRGVPFVLCTGRPLRWLPQVVQQLPVKPYCVCANGAIIYDAYHDEVLHQTSLSPSVVQEVMTAVRSAIPGACVAVERLVEKHYIASSSPATQHRSPCVADERCPYDWGPAVELVSHEALLSRPAIKLLIRHETYDSATLAEQVLHTVGHMVSLTYSVSNGLVECAHPAASKGEALCRILDHFDLSEQGLLAFGDMPNDGDMLRLARWGVAVENAHPQVKESADEVTASNDDEGVAQVLERYFP